MNNEKIVQSDSSEKAAHYYSFEEYISKQRVLTYWYQILEVVNCKPSSVLEIGVGTGMVKNYLSGSGYSIDTMDANPKLKPDVVANILDDTSFGERTYDVVLCARVLHHLGYENQLQALANLARASNKFVILTLPVEDFSIYLSLRWTSIDPKTIRIPMPLIIKKMLFWKKSRSGLWKIGDNAMHSIEDYRNKLEELFKIHKEYRLPEEASHIIFVLEKR